MKRGSVVFLQVCVLLCALLAVFLLIGMPLREGRADNLDILHIYIDPLILYGYATSVGFFVALLKVFKLLGAIGRDELFTLASVKKVRSMKYCAIIVGVMVIGAGVYIRLFHDPADDPAGFLGMSFLGAFVSAVVAIALSVFEKVLQRAVDMRSENDLTI
ncbi:MAG: DUF2975 domain-containing protein [Chitinophagales bacterium]